MPAPSPVKALCAAQGITLTDLAGRTGYSAGTIHNVSNGSVAPWPELRRRLTEALGVDPFAEAVA